MRNVVTLFLIVFALTAAVSAQDRIIDISEIPIATDRTPLFAPPGWKVEKTAKGDLNADGKIDQAITLIEDKPFDADDAPKPDRNRVLVVAFSDGKKLDRIAVADKLLQCTSCGGAFYGVMDAPVGVTIARGVLVVSQQHGSRNVSESTFRFRYEPSSQRFILIGYDFNDRDRADGSVASESTNYVTGLRVTRTGKGKRITTKRTTIKPTPIYLDTIEGDAVEYAALERLGMG